MAETVIYAEKELAFSLSSNFGCYASMEYPATFSLTDNEEYSIVWDTETYTRTAFSFTAADGSACVAIGNPVAAGLDANEDTFAIVYDSTHNYLWFLSLETKETHNVGIYRIAEDEPAEEPEIPDEPAEPEGIVLKDRNGKDVAYYGIETVTFDTTTQGKQQVYTKGVAVEGLEIVPDFSAGDMPVVAADNTLVKSATIKKPDTLLPDNVRNGVQVSGVSGTFIGDTEAVEVDLSMADGDQVISSSAVGKVLSGVTVKKPETLIPENIAEGINIAGILGTLAATGGAKVAFGSMVYNSTSKTIVHNLGVLPDVIFFVAHYNMSSGTTSSRTLSAFAASAAFTAANPDYSSGARAYFSGSKWYGKNYSVPMEQATTSAENCIYNVTETEFTILPETCVGLFIAIAGLT